MRKPRKGSLDQLLATIDDAFCEELKSSCVEIGAGDLEQVFIDMMAMDEPSQSALLPHVLKGVLHQCARVGGPPSAIRTCIQYFDITPSDDADSAMRSVLSERECAFRRIVSPSQAAVIRDVLTHFVASGWTPFWEKEARASARFFGRIADRGAVRKREA